jgi:uncharacterized protein
MTQASNAAEGFAVTRAYLSDVAILDGKPERTADGYLKAHARVARSGIQIYRGHELGRPELGDVKVFRPEREVFSVDAMKSLAHRPLTLNHPRENVNADNWKKYVIGYSGDEVLRDGEHVRIPLLICDSAAIQAATHDGIRELSCGYAADINWSPGRTPSGEDYDATQSAIRGNHIALVENARGGDMLRLGDDATPTKTCWSCAQRIAEDTKICPMCRADQDYVPTDEVQTEADLQNAIKAMARGKNFNASKDRIYKAAKRLGKTETLPEDWNIGDASANYFDKEFSTEKRKKLAKTGAAMKSGGFPVESKADLENAIQAFGRAKDPAATKAHIIKRARALGAVSSLPENWNVKDEGEGEAVMNVMIDGVPVGFADDAGAAYVQRMIDGLKRQLVDARRKDQKTAKSEAGEEEQEAGGGQEHEDQDDQAEEIEAERAKSKKEDRRKDSRDARDGEIAVLRKQLADAKRASMPQSIDQMVAERMAVIDVATPLLERGYSFEGKDNGRIRRDAVMTAGIADADKMDDKEVLGAFRALTNGAGNASANAGRHSSYGRMVDGMSRGVAMSDRDMFNERANMGPRNGPFNMRDAERARDSAYADKIRYLNTAWQGRGTQDAHGNNSNNFNRDF